ncbi:KilA-N domain-containing protein, partial [Escherichia coli]
RGGGTWLHPKLAVRFARWLSVDFEIWCDEQIDAIIQGSVHHIDDERIKAIFLLDKSQPDEADRSFTAGQACERIYDAVRGRR